MAGTRITVDLPEALHARLVEKARRSGVPIDTVLADLVGAALGSDSHAAGSSEDYAPRHAAELKRARDNLGDLAESGQQDRGPVSPSEARAGRRGRPVLDPPMSRMMIEGRAEQVRRVRAVLGDLAESAPETDSPSFDPSVARQLRLSRPILDPPLSDTIAEGRDDLT